MVALAAFEQIAQDHRVGERPGQVDAGPGERQQVVLDVLADLLDGRIGQDRAKGLERRRAHRESRPPKARAPAGTTPPPAAMKRRGPRAGAQGVDGGCLGVQAEPRLAAELVQEFRQGFGGIDEMIAGLPGLFGGGAGRAFCLLPLDEFVAKSVEAALKCKAPSRLRRRGPGF